MKTKELKRRYLESDSNLKSWYESEISPRIKSIQQQNQKIYRLLQDALDKKMFSPGMMKYVQKELSELSDQSKLWTLTQYIDELKDAKMRKKYQHLLDKIKRIREEISEKITIKESETHYRLSEFRPIDPVEYVSYSQPFTTVPVDAFRKYLRMAGKDPDTKIGYKIVKDNLMCLQVDLTYSKRDILEACDEAVTVAQGLEGKRGRRAATSLQQDLFDMIFKKHYLDKKSKYDALEKTREDLVSLGILIATNSLQRKYIPALKRKYGIKDIRELISGGDF